MARPNSHKTALVRNIVLLAGLAAAIPPTGRFLQRFGNEDPLGAAKNRDVIESGILMRMEGVQLRHYDRKGLITAAKCDQVLLASDRQTYDLHGVRDALYRGDQGTFHYTAGHANFVEGSKELKADKGIHIRNADMNLTAKSLEYNGRLSKLLVRGNVAGKLKGGDFKASNVEYKLDSGAYRAGPVYWKGMLALNLQDEGEQQKPTTWEIQGALVTYSGKNGQIATYTNAVAADDEVILIAPKVVHDRKSDVLTATGRVQYFSAKADLVADKCVVYRKEKRAELIGSVLMYVKPKKDQNGKPKVEPLPAFQPLNPDQVKPQRPTKKLTEEEKKNAEQLRDSKTIRDFPMVMVAAKIDYWYAKGARRAVITGAPQGRQELADGRWRHVWSNVGFYDGEKEVLKLVSSKGLKDTRMKNSIGDDLTADWMEVSTKEEEDELTGYGFIGKVVSLDDEETGGSGAEPPKAGEPPKTELPKTEPPKKGGGTGVDPKKSGGGKR
jgi:hypothetical protein